MSVFAVVGDLVEILGEDNKSIHCGTVLADEVSFDPKTLLDRRYVVVSGWKDKVADSDVRIVLAGI